MIKQLLPSRVCLKCQGCCRFLHRETLWSPFLLKEDIQELLAHKIPPSLISSTNKIRLFPDIDNDNFVCAFLNTQDNRCKVYPFRPFECQLYPFLINRKLNKVFLACDLRCPFAKENLNTEGFKKHTRYLVGLLNSPTQIKLLRNNPGVFQSYDEVYNLAELKLNFL